MSTLTAAAAGNQVGTHVGTAANSDRERLAGVVQAVGRRPADIARRPWESVAVFAVFTAAYSAIGLWLVIHLHVVGFETLDRFDRALMIWHNSPPKLAAVGFDYPPLSVLLVSPFTLVPALARSMVLIPVSSALFAAAVMVVLNTMLRRATVPGGLRVVVLAALGLNPLVVMYASLGARDFLWLAFAVTAVGALMAWYVTADVRFVMVAGLAYAAAALTGYGSLVWFVVSAVTVAAILSRLGADGTEVEGTTVGFAAPTVYAITLWTAFNLIILFSPVHWLTSDTDVAGASAQYSLGEVIGGVAGLVLRGAPIAIVVLPALLWAGSARRDTFALWLGLLLAVTILAPGVSSLLRITDSPLMMDNALPVLLVSVVGAVWLARSALAGPNAVAGALGVALLLSIPWTFHAMVGFGHQGLERTFHDAVSTGRSQEGTTTRDGHTVGYANEQDMADYIRDHVFDTDAVLTDDAHTYGVIYLTGEPGVFLDRVDRSDGPWTQAAADPAAAHVRYLLLSADSRTDRLSELYPTAAQGRDASLPTVHANSRYVLVEVPAGYRYNRTSEIGPATSTPCGTGAAVGGVDGEVGEGDCPPTGTTGSTSTTGSTTMTDTTTTDTGGSGISDQSPFGVPTLGPTP